METVLNLQRPGAHIWLRNRGRPLKCFIIQTWYFPLLQLIHVNPFVTPPPLHLSFPAFFLLVRYSASSTLLCLPRPRAFQSLHRNTWALIFSPRPTRRSPAAPLAPCLTVLIFNTSHIHLLPRSPHPVSPLPPSSFAPALSLHTTTYVEWLLLPGHLLMQRF